MNSWDSGVWFNSPVSAVRDGDALVVTAAKGSDFWQQTSYGFRRDSGHALLSPFASGTAIEVSFVVDYTELYDQAGVVVRVDEATWVKAGVEISDGAPQLAAVVTMHGMSDWSTAPMPQWSGREVSIRASWAGDALTVRARADAEPWRMLRLAPFPPDATATAGPYCCAPERDGLSVRFTNWTSGTADTALHLES
ncbi:MAG: DUF1349 domain-containing protein [Mycobacteriales bacterium]